MLDPEVPEPALLKLVLPEVEVDLLEVLELSLLEVLELNLLEPAAIELELPETVPVVPRVVLPEVTAVASMLSGAEIAVETAGESEGSVTLDGIAPWHVMLQPREIVMPFVKNGVIQPAESIGMATITVTTDVCGVITSGVTVIFAAGIDWLFSTDCASVWAWADVPPVTILRRHP